MKSGFTLIELLVAIGIVVLLTAASLTGITASKNRRQVKTTAEKLKYTINEAIAQAKTPDDTLHNLYKIQIRIYPYNSNDPDNTNKVDVYNCFNSTCTSLILNSKLSFKPSKGVFVDSSQSPSQGNMIKNNSPLYYYFSACANTTCSDVCEGVTYINTVGQLTNYNHFNPPTEDSVYLRVMDNPDYDSSNNVYKVRAYIDSSLVINEKEKPI